MTDRTPTRREILRWTGVASTVPVAGATGVGARTTGDGSWSTASPAGRAAAPSQVARFTPDKDSSTFGQTTAMSGGTVLVGDQRESEPNGRGAGVVYVYERSGGSWSQQTKLAADDGDDGDQLARSVAIDGDTAVAGAIRDEDPNGGGAGSAYVFQRSDGSWSQQAKLAADDGDDGDLFGGSVAVSGDTVVVGSRGEEDPNGKVAGAAYVFQRSGGSWSQQAKLLPGDGDDIDKFGRGVAVSGDTAAVAAPGDEDPNGRGAGSVYVFARSGGSWSKQAKLAAEDGRSRDELGFSLAMSGDTVVAGAHGASKPNGPRSGAAYVFGRSGGSWSQQAKLVADDGDKRDEFGRAVDVAGDTVVVGAMSDEKPNGPDAGSAYLFRKGDDGWSQQAKLAAEDGNRGDSFGWGAALGSDAAVVGAPSGGGPARQGAAYVFAPVEIGSTGGGETTTDSGGETTTGGGATATDSGGGTTGGDSGGGQGLPGFGVGTALGALGAGALWHRLRDGDDE